MRNQKIAQCLEKTVERAQEVFHLPLVAPNLTLTMQGTRGRFLGLFFEDRRKTSWIYINPKVAILKPDFIETLVIHEVAHWVCHALGFDEEDPHGEGWQMVYATLGGKNPESLNQSPEFQGMWAPTRFFVWQGCGVEEFLTEEEHVKAITKKPSWASAYTGRKIVL